MVLSYIIKAKKVQIAKIPYPYCLVKVASRVFYSHV